MRYLKQLWYELRQQPLVTWVTVSGTALSIFLIMSMYMIKSIDTVEAEPEIYRSRTLIGNYAHIQIVGDPASNSSGNISLSLAHKLYENLDGVDLYSYGSGYNMDYDVNIKDGISQTFELKEVDDNFWKIYSFHFLEGVPFTPAQVKAGEKRVIITDRVAFQLAGNESLLGKEIYINHVPYVVTGIIESASPLLKESYSDLYIPFKENPQSVWQKYLGMAQVTMLLKEGTKVEDIKKEVARRYEVFNQRLRKEVGSELVYHNLPYTAKEMKYLRGSNNDPADSSPKKDLIIYGILLLVPALNLSGMTRSRLRRRVSEIGVRRAYGATRGRITMELLLENFCLTLAGGIIGLLLSFIFISCFSNLFVDYIELFDTSQTKGYATPSFSMFFNWGSFLIVLLFCFLLNILSTGIPSWLASRVNPAEAISTRR